MNGQTQIGAYSGAVSNRTVVVASLVTAIISISFYWATAFRTITWWENGEYALAALTLGIPAPPGSQLAVVLGWIVSRLPFGISRIMELNFLGGVWAATTVALVCAISLRLLPRSALSFGNLTPKFSAGLLAAIAVIGSLIFSFGQTHWSLATQFTPYTLTPLFTMLILWAMLRWWENVEQPSELRWLMFASLLFGLDLSVHRTNLLLIPGVITWILLRHPGVLKSAKMWLSSVASFIAGCGFHLITIPLAARKPPLNMGDPSTWSGFWDYFTVKQYGGNMLINLFPRKAPFFSVQLADYWKIFSDNFAHFTGTAIIGVLPLVWGWAGLWLLWKRDRRLAVGMLVMFLCASIFGVVYFNTPAHFFRSMDRHYLPSLAIFTTWIVYGSLSLIQKMLHGRTGWRNLPTALLVALVLVCPVHQLLRNFKAANSVGSFFAYDFARNALETLPPDAILLTAGDNDTFPLLYAQRAENIRADVDVLNIYLLNTPWFLEELRTQHASVPFELSAEEIPKLRMPDWRDTTISLAVTGTSSDFNLPVEIIMPDSIHLRVPPSINDKYLMLSDWLILRLLKNNHWSRPICFMITVPTDNYSWIQPFLRLDGLFYRVVPAENAPLNVGPLKDCFFKTFCYRGYDNPRIYLDPVSSSMAINYYAIALELMTAEPRNGDAVACRETRAFLLENLPQDRIRPPEAILQGLKQLCPDDGNKTRQ
jgi:hypothetical protein